MHYKEKADTYIQQCLLFLISPFITLLVSILNSKKKGAQLGAVLFCSFFGFTFVISGVDMDAATLVRRFNQYQYFDITYLWDILIGYFTLQGDPTDIVEPIVHLIISRFTDNYQWLFAALGLIFGFFYIKNIWFHLKKNAGKMNINAILFFIAMIVVINPMNGINQFRFWTATMVFVYGFLNYLDTNEKKYVFISACSVFFHFGLFIFVPPLLFVVLWWKNEKFIIGIPVAILIISFMISNIELLGLSGFITYLGPIITERFETYTSISAFGYAEQLGSRAWYAVWWRPLLIYVGVICLGYIYFFRYEEISQRLKKYFLLLLILISLTVLISNFPLVFRYQSAVIFMIFSFITIFFQENGSAKINFLQVVAIFPILLMMGIQIKSLLASTNAYIFISNFFINQLTGNQLSLLELL